MNIQDYSPQLAISVQREIIENQRTTIEYWRGQVADRDERIKVLEAALNELISIDDLCIKIAGIVIDSENGEFADELGTEVSNRDDALLKNARKLMQKGGDNG